LLALFRCTAGFLATADDTTVAITNAGAEAA
jgi:hypothetical protein